MNNLKQRALTGTILAIVIFASIVWSPYSMFLLILAINILGLREFYGLFHLYTVSPRNLSGFVLSLTILAGAAVFSFFPENGKVLLLPVPALFGVFLLELYLKSEYPIHNLAFIVLGVLWITIPLGFFTGIIFYHGAHDYQQAALGYFFILWASDTGAYFAGKYFGRHLLFKRISPKKTWEGSIGGAGMALGVSYLISRYFTFLNMADWMCIALIIQVTGTFGDLFKSVMKRSLQIKDTGTILPGHGGILDRFDSLLGSAPFVFIYLALVPHA